MSYPAISRLAIAFAISAIIAAACGRASRTQHSESNPVAPSAATSPASNTTATAPAGLHLPADVSRPFDVTFPPRDQPFAFGNQLNVLYRDSLSRPPVSTFVDLEGFIVWIQEYLRYRVNGCTHEDAIARVLQQINGGGVPAVCAAPPTGVVSFPPRDQSFAFGTQLNVVYRDTLRRNPVATFVDLEGWIVWIQEYLRYRVNSCGHDDAQNKVFTQINGGGIPPVCTCAYTLSSVGQQFTAAGSQSGVTISQTSGTCSWSASTNVPWISFTTATTGTGNATLSYVIAPNTAGFSRNGAVTVQWSGGSASVAIFQAGTAATTSSSTTSSTTTTTPTTSSTTSSSTTSSTIAPSASFSYSPNPCVVTGGSPVDSTKSILTCTFTASTTVSSVTRYDYRIANPGKAQPDFSSTSSSITNAVIPCGTFNSGAVSATVYLTIVSSTGATFPALGSVNFRKDSGC